MAKRKPMLKKGDTVDIAGRRWFQRSYGNTYHTVQVSVLPKGGDHWILVGETEGPVYGYGNHYEQTGREILEEAYSMPRGWKKNREGGLWALRDYGVNYISRAEDVRRERDL